MSPLNSNDEWRIKCMIQDFHDDKVVPYHRENQEKLAKLQLTQAVWSGGLAVLIFLMPLIWHWLGVK